MDPLPHEKEIFEYEKMISQLRKDSKEKKDHFLGSKEILPLEKKLLALKQKVYSNLTSWQRILICRHTQRPKTIDYIQHICDDFQELYGDRLYADDQALIGGIASIGGKKFMVIGQEKGNDTESRLKHNFGCLNPEGFRKALRLVKLAEKFSLPVLSLLDTQGAFCGLSAEERGQGWAIANNLREMSSVETPIIVIVIGEGASGGALGVGIGDSIAMLEHAYYSVISPEGCASILWKDVSKKEDAAAALKLNAEDLLEFRIIDAIIDEPLGGAHHDPKLMYETVKDYVLTRCEALQKMSKDELLDLRYKKFRNMGEFQVQES
jgi:acetyl-CoA carboxylase carboxyl transferase subunit alpha